MEPSGKPTSQVLGPESGPQWNWLTLEMDVNIRSSRGMRARKRDLCQCWPFDDSNESPISAKSTGKHYRVCRQWLRVQSKVVERVLDLTRPVGRRGQTHVNRDGGRPPDCLLIYAKSPNNITQHASVFRKHNLVYSQNHTIFELKRTFSKKPWVHVMV